MTSGEPLSYAVIRTSFTSGTRLMMCARIAGEKVAGETSQSGQPPEIAMVATPELARYSTRLSRQCSMRSNGSTSPSIVEIRASIEETFAAADRIVV